MWYASAMKTLTNVARWIFGGLSAESPVRIVSASAFLFLFYYILFMR